MNASGQKRASSHSLAITNDTRHRDSEKSSGTMEVMDITGQAQVKLSFWRSVFLKLDHWLQTFLLVGSGPDKGRDGALIAVTAA